MEATTALAQRREAVFDADKVALIKRMIAPNAKPDELALFVQVCQRTGLDPFARQIYCIHRGGKMGIQTSIDGFRLIAERTKHYAGQLGPFWCGDDGEWKDVWLSNKPPRAAKVGALRDDFKEPCWSVANWEFYAQQSPLWQKGGAHMLAKCAESLALRKAFPQELSGLYTGEEMSQADTGEEMSRADGPEYTPPQAKAPRANTIKHDGTFASHKQVTLLHVMRSKVGGLVWCSDKAPCYVFDDMDQRDKQAVKVLCAYHKQLAAFKDVDGRPITSSVNLSETQISNLIDRYDAKIAQQEKRAAEDPDIGAAFDRAEENARLRAELGPGSDG